MTCSGCSSAISRVLTRMKDQGAIADFEVSLEQQTATVTPKSDGSPSLEQVQEKIAKTGKEIKSAEVVA